MSHKLFQADWYEHLLHLPPHSLLPSSSVLLARTSAFEVCGGLAICPLLKGTISWSCHVLSDVTLCTATDGNPVATVVAHPQHMPSLKAFLGSSYMWMLIKTSIYRAKLRQVLAHGLKTGEHKKTDTHIPTKERSGRNAQFRCPLYHQHLKVET